MPATLTIGAVAAQSGTSIQAVRYYGRRGLLLPAERRESGYRLYTPEAVRVLRFIKNAQSLGFSLDEIGKLLKLRVNRRSQCESVRRQAQVRLESVHEKIEGLKSIQRALQRLLRTCASRGRTDYCPILKSLEETEKSK